MKFLSPWWLWGLLILPLFYLGMVLDERRRKRQFGQFIQTELWPLIVPELSPRYRVYKARFLILGFASLLIALAQPQYGTHEEVVEMTGLDVMLVLDISNSMNVEDLVPSRLKAAKHFTRTLIDQLEGDRVGLVAFAGSSYVACPLTADLTYLTNTIQIMGPRIIQKQGTDIGAGLETALKALERGGQDSAKPEGNNVPSHVIILISDGEDHEGGAVAAAALAKTSGVRLYVVGVGTEKGGPIPLYDDKGNLLTYKKDRKGQPIVSTFSPNSLSQIADAAGGRYWSITPGEREAEELIQDLKGLNRTDYGERKFLVYEERFQIPLALAILFFLLEMSVMARRVLPLMLVGLITSSWVPPVRAEGPTAPLGSYLENQKGLEAFKEGNIEEAQKSFGAAQARDPSRPELQFNQGIVQFQQGDVDHAIEAFRNSARSAQKSTNQDLYGKSLYNLGNAFAKKGDAKEAIQSYLGAIQSAREQKNQRLEDESRKNLELLLKQLKKQEEKKQSDQSKDNKEQEKNQDQSKNDPSQSDQSKGTPQDKSKESSKDDARDQSKEQSKDPAKDQNNTGQSDQDQKDKKDQAQSAAEKPGESQDKIQDESKDKSQGESKDESKAEAQNKYNGEDKSAGKPSDRKSGKQQFQSNKMKPEDADRVMSELTNRDRELQEKLQTQNGPAQNNSKDW